MMILFLPLSERVQLDGGQPDFLLGNAVHDPEFSSDDHRAEIVRSGGAVQFSDALFCSEPRSPDKTRGIETTSISGKQEINTWQ